MAGEGVLEIFSNLGDFVNLSSFGERGKRK